MQRHVSGAVGNSGRNDILPLSGGCVYIYVIESRRDQWQQRGVIECCRGSEEGGILGKKFWPKGLHGGP